MNSEIDRPREQRILQFLREESLAACFPLEQSEVELLVAVQVGRRDERRVAPGGEVTRGLEGVARGPEEDGDGRLAAVRT